MATEESSQFEWGPFVQVAAFCERVLREDDGVISLIRVIDRITHTARGPNAPEEMPEVRYPLTIVLALKPGRARGRHEVTITPEMPSGETMAPVITSVQLEGEARGTNIVTSVDIPFRMEGLYWFIIRFDGHVITRVPLEIRYARVVTGPATSA